MYKRICNTSKSNSFFLFGARGTGKTSLLRSLVSGDSTLWIDLLRPEEEEIFVSHPSRLSEMISRQNKIPEWVVIDEVQKAPKLLDVVHLEIEARGIKFALTGSSARKLKRGGANLLAGRAFLYHLYPLTCFELGDDFNLRDYLSWGGLPKIHGLKEDADKAEFLKSYVTVYLKEEIFQEQLVRNTIPFRKFLPIAAQMSGKLLNFNTIAKDLGVDWTTVRSYYEILEDTWLGFTLPGFSRSLRKQQLQSGKFYLFDIGVQRALDRTLSVAVESSQLMGPLFEQFIILHCHWLNEYRRSDFRFSHLATQGGLEIDLVIERPGRPTVLAEIKSTENVREDHLKHLKSLVAEFPEFEAICLCREKHPRKLGPILILPWQDGLREIGLLD